MSAAKFGPPPFGAIPEEQATLARLIELHNSGLPLRKIGIELDKAGMPTRGGGPWWSATIAGILRQHGFITAYAGTGPELRAPRVTAPRDQASASAPDERVATDQIALSKVGCETCLGIGRTEDGSICACVNRKIFGIVYGRVRYAMQGHHLNPSIPLDRFVSGSGGGKRGVRSHVNEDLIAEFTLIGKRILSPDQHQLFRFAYILGADVRACAKRLGLDRGQCLQRLQAIEATCGAYFRDVRPYPIYPLKSYFDHWQPGGARPCLVPVVRSHQWGSAAPTPGRAARRGVMIAIPLGGKAYPGMFALIDDDDYPLVSAYKWWPIKAGYTFYATSNTPGPNRKTLLMHRLLVGVPGLYIDHRDRNGLNNQRGNLRPATSQQNQGNCKINVNNTSGFRGVAICKQNKWQAGIQESGHRVHLGYFDSPIDAARAYDIAAKAHFGDFARLNFPAQEAA